MNVVLSSLSNIPTMDIVSRIFDIHRDYIEEGLIGFRPPVSYADACDKGEMLLAVEDGEIYGFAHFRKLKDSRIRLYAIAVDPLKRREGIGTLLIDRLKNCYGSHIFTEVKTVNLVSLLFFEKNGFVRVGIKDKGDYKVWILRASIRPDTGGKYWIWNSETKVMNHIRGLTD